MTTRISGLGSGMDIDSLVSSLMKAEKIPLDKMNQKKQTLSWKTDLYREVNTKMASFRDFLNGMRFTGSWSQTKVTSSDSTNISVASSPTASAISHTIQVNGLASGATTASATGISAAPSLTAGSAPTSTTITAGSNDQFNVTLNGVTKSVTLTAGTYTNTTLNSEIQTELNNAFGANQIVSDISSGAVSFTPNGTAGNLPQVVVGAVSGNNGLSNLGFQDQQSFKVNTSVALSSASSKLVTPLTFDGTGNAYFKVNGVMISYSNTDSLSSIISKVNNSSAGVNMSYDPITDKITTSTKSTGVTAQIKFEDGTVSGGTGNFVSAMNLSTSAITGKDADVKIDGNQSYRSSNNFTLDGVTYTLNGVTAGPVTVGITKDTDAIFNKIKDFVSNYNDTIGLVNLRTNEVHDNSFPPLTDDQKASMSATDITNWENKAKTGLLKNDSTLKQASTSFRSFMSTTVQSINTSYNSMSNIGITTASFGGASSYNSVQAGSLVIDETKLKAAIQQDPDGVISLFSNQPGATANPNMKGIAQAMYDQANTAITSLSKMAGKALSLPDDITTSLGSQIHKLENDISDFNSKLSTKEDNYYKKFTLMDQAVADGNTKLNWLAKQFG